MIAWGLVKGAEAGSQVVHQVQNCHVFRNDITKAWNIIINTIIYNIIIYYIKLNFEFVQGGVKIRSSLKPNETPAEIDEKVQQNIRHVKSVAGNFCSLK